MFPSAGRQEHHTAQNNGRIPIAIETVVASFLLLFLRGDEK
jgi:hypothetical protein